MNGRLVLMAAVFSGALVVAPAADSGAQRLAPPSVIQCSRDHLTSFTGRVLAYERGPQRIFIRVRTDEETTEEFTLRLKSGEEWPKYFLLRGEEFKAEDWKLIEARQSRLRPRMRATIWVCDNGPQPVIDWRPPES